MSMNEIRAMREKRVKLWEAAKAFVESRKDVSGTLSAEDLSLIHISEPTRH